MTAISEIHLIANPISGRGRGRRLGQSLAQALAFAGHAFSLSWTERPGHAEDLARRAVEAGARVVVVCGGDGTVQQAARALAGSGCALAPQPAGRCNDFCRAMGWGAGAGALLKALDRGRTRKVDLARAGGRYYCTVGAVGFDALVSRFVESRKVRLLSGTPAYLHAVLRVLAAYQSPLARLVWDDGAYEGPFFLAAVANTPTYGNGMPIVPMARPGDGLLDVCLIRPAGFWRVVSLLPSMLKGSHGRAHEVNFLRTTRLEITAPTPIEMWADGEPLGQTPLTVEAVPGALVVLEAVGD
jgi:YegS/Rv2252/BmrU family lipid kinase